jgi:hypothetical protein
MPDGVSGERRTPRKARCELTTLPNLAIWPARSLTVLDGIAKPMPGAAPPPSCGLVAASVGMPTTWLWRSTSAPPLLPGLIGALV